MIYKIYPIKDSTIYSKYPTYNAGRDEIIELRKEQSSYSSSVYENSRMLVEFDISSVPSSVLNNFSQSYLNIYCADAEGVATSFTVDVNKATHDWEEGCTSVIDDFVVGGVSWNTYDGSGSWASAGGDFSTSSLDTSSQEITINYDLRVDVSSIVNQWITGSSDNFGFLIKKSDVDESNSLDIAKMAFYSRNTHTVYLPELEFSYDDHIYNTSSFFPMNQSGSISASLLTEPDIYINPLNIKREYLYGTTNRFYLKLRTQHPVKTFYEIAVNAPVYYVEDNLFYSIVDSLTNMTIIPFGDNSRISLSSNGYFFDVIFGCGFMPNRFYKILYKVKIGDDTIYSLEGGIFKVVQ